MSKEAVRMDVIGFVNKMSNSPWFLRASRKMFEKTLKDELEAGFRGDLEARRRYEQGTALAHSLLPPWAVETANGISRRHINKLDPKWRLLKPSFRGLIFKSIDWSKKFENQLRKRSSNSLRQDSKRRLNAIANFFSEMPVFLSHAIALEHFLTIHPMALTDGEKIRAALNTPDIWSIPMQKPIREHLAAEAELEDVFGKYFANAEERAKAVRLFAKAPTEANRTRVIRELRESREMPSLTKAAKKVPPIASTTAIATRKPPSGKRQFIAFIRSTFPDLPKDSRDYITRRLIDLDTKGLLPLANAADIITKYSGQDYEGMVSRLYNDYIGTELTLNQEQHHQTALPVPELPRLEPTAELLDRLDNSDEITPSDVNTLRKRATQEHLTESQMSRALGHIILYRLAQGGNLPGHSAYRILLRTIAPRHGIPTQAALSQEVVRQLVRDSKIVKRNGIGIPTDRDNAKIHPDLLKKYHGR